MRFGKPVVFQVDSLAGRYAPGSDTVHGVLIHLFVQRPLMNESGTYEDLADRMARALLPAGREL